MDPSACDFVVHIYQSEIDEIRRNYEEQKPTGGDLFGLWTGSGNVVVHLALEASVQSARPDLESFLKENYMLCHVGKWQYDSNEAPNTKPGELEQTASETATRHCARDDYKSHVLLTFPSGHQNENVQAYFFLEQGAKSCNATLRILAGTESTDETSHNPLRNVLAIQKELEKHRKSGNEINKEDIGGQGRASSSSQIDEHNGENENARPAGSSIVQTQQPVSNSGNSIHPNSSTSSQSPSNSAGQQPAAPGFLSGATGERILEEVLKEICSMVQDPQKIDVQRTLATGYIELKFEINETKFEVQFPKTFPDVPAKISATSPKNPYQLDLKGTSQNEELDSLKSIINALRFLSDGVFNPQPSTHQLTATALAELVATLFSKAVQAVSRKHDPKEEATLMKLSEEMCVKVTDTFPKTSAVNVQIKKDKPGDRVELTFEHNQNEYLIAIPVEFPEKSARIYHLVFTKKYDVQPKKDQHINTLSEIVKVIKHYCSCVPCKRSMFE